MEVAVSKKLASFALVGSVAGLFALLSGCADPLTYSQDFKREGLRQFNRGQYLDAAGSFQAAAKQDPTDYQTQYYLGLSYEKTNDYQLAVEAYSWCLKQRTQTPNGRFDVAMREKVITRLSGLIARSTHGEPEIDAIQQAAAADRSPDEYRLLARIYALRGDPDSAVDSYRRALSFAPDDALLSKEYGFYMLKINQLAEATRLLKISYDANSSDRQVARTLQELGVTDSQLNVSSTRIEEQAADTTPPQSAWDMATTPKD
jgi:Tfp pilus assembly protein PilF